MVAIDITAFVLAWHQGFHRGVKETSVTFREQKVTACFVSASVANAGSQLLLKLPKEMEHKLQATAP
jgi:hypothetical protein